VARVLFSTKTLLVSHLIGTFSVSPSPIRLTLETLDERLGSNTVGSYTDSIAAFLRFGVTEAQPVSTLTDKGASSSTQGYQRV
jgi:hypothetical protein